MKKIKMQNYACGNPPMVGDIIKTDILYCGEPATTTALVTGSMLYENEVTFWNGSHNKLKTEQFTLVARYAKKPNDIGD